jgi:O-phosphoseryl-tRNA(Cys) synthetase
VYPQFYTSSSFSDKQIADSIAIKQQPKTKLGKEIAKKIETGILKYKDEIGVKKFLTYEDKNMKVFVSEYSWGKRERRDVTLLR